MEKGPLVSNDGSSASRDLAPDIDAHEQVMHLLKAVETRDIIGQAKGILMERFKISADEAFDRLRQMSQQSNRKVRDLAQELAETGEWPVVSADGVS